jgi:hypothetical protein
MYLQIHFDHLCQNLFDLFVLLIITIATYVISIYICLSFFFIQLTNIWSGLQYQQAWNPAPYASHLCPSET